MKGATAVDGPIDRRGFLTGAGVAGLSLAYGAGAGWVARAAGTPSGPPIRGQVIRRGASGFLQAAHVYNERFDGVLPNLVARPLDAADVVTAVKWGVAHGVPLRARSGGHSYAGYSTLSGGMVLDLRNMRGITVNTRKRTATIGAGSQLIDVYAALAAHGVTIPAGSCPSVGIAGHALGGGMGLAGRQFGLTADNLLSAQIVTADGRLRTASATEQSRSVLGASRRGRRELRRRDQLHVPRAPGPANGRRASPSAGRGRGRRCAGRLAGVGAARAIADHVDLPSERRRRCTSVNVSGQYFGPASDLRGLLAPLTAVAGRQRLFRRFRLPPGAADVGGLLAHLA